MIVVLCTFSSCLPPFFPTAARFCSLLPGGKKERKGKSRTGKRYQRFSPQGYSGGARKRGWGPPALQRSRSPFPGVGDEGRRGDAPGGAAACPRPPALPATPPRPRRALGSPCGEGCGGGDCGAHRGSAAGAAEGRRDGGMDGWMDEGRRDGKMEG